jgi:hypothetical protein
LDNKKTALSVHIAYIFIIFSDIPVGYLGPTPSSKYWGNRKELAKACGKYLLATRMASVKEIKETVLSQPGRYRKLSDNLYAKEVNLANKQAIHHLL